MKNGRGDEGADKVALTEQQKFNNIAWNLPSGQALRAKIEAIVAQLKSEEALLEEKNTRRISVKQAHEQSVALVEVTQHALALLQARKGEIDSVLGDVRQQLEDIKTNLLKLTKADLDQLRRMPDPPIPVRRTLEMLHLILKCQSVNVNQKVDYERQCRRTLSSCDLIPAIINFDVALLGEKPQVVGAIEKNYLGATDKAHDGQENGGKTPENAGRGTRVVGGRLRLYGPLAVLEEAERHIKEEIQAGKEPAEQEPLLQAGSVGWASREGLGLRPPRGLTGLKGPSLLAPPMSPVSPLSGKMSPLSPPSGKMSASPSPSSAPPSASPPSAASSFAASFAMAGGFASTAGAKFFGDKLSGGKLSGEGGGGSLPSLGSAGGLRSPPQIRRKKEKELPPDRSNSSSLSRTGSEGSSARIAGSAAVPLTLRSPPLAKAPEDHAASSASASTTSPPGANWSRTGSAAAGSSSSSSSSPARTGSASAATGGSAAAVCVSSSRRLSLPAVVRAVAALEGGGTHAKRRGFEAAEPLTLSAVSYSSAASGVLFSWCVCQVKLMRVRQQFEATFREEAQLAAESAGVAAQAAGAEAAARASGSEAAALQAACVHHQAAVAELRRRLAALQAEGSSMEQRAAAMAEGDALEQRAALQRAALAREKEKEKEKEKKREKETPQRKCVHCKAEIFPQDQVYKREEGFLHVHCQREFDALEPESAASFASITEVKVEITESLHFATASADVSEQVVVSSLSGVLRAIANNPDVKIQIEGHSDINEPPHLALRRAQAVQRALLMRGVQAARVRADGYAAEYGPRAYGCGAGKGGTEAHNRRVTFSVIQEIHIGGSIHFGAMSCSIGAAAEPLLQQVVTLLQGRPHLHVRVEGHTCSAPSWGVSNAELSQSRAAAVVGYLVDKGIASERLESKGWGEELPLYPESERKQNRRVEFHIQTRASQRGLRELVASEARRQQLANDTAALEALRRVAAGASGGSCLVVRRAAADVLIAVACGADWRVLRLLLLAHRKGDGSKCSMASLDLDCIRQLMRWVLMVKE